MRIKLKGVAKVRKKLASGRTAIYYYAWRGGPRLEGVPGSPEFHTSYAAAHATRLKTPDDMLRSIFDGFQDSSDFTSLAERTRKDYRKHIRHIDGEFGDFPVKVLNDRRTRNEFLAWRDRLGATSAGQLIIGSRSSPVARRSGSELPSIRGSSALLVQPVSSDTILRLIRAAHLDPPVPPRVVGIDDWAWRRGTRYGTIIVDLERNRVIDLLPDRSAGSVATWLKRHPGIEIIARDRAGVYADGARRGAPGAIQIADRWHLLSNLGDTLRNILGKHRKAVNVANQLVLASKDLVGPPARPQALARLRADRRNARRETFAEILRLRERGLTPSRIAPIVGMETRAVQRWLAAGGEPEHTRPPARTSLIDPFHDYLFQRWQEGCHVGRQLLVEIRARGYRGGHATLFRHLAIWRDGPVRRPSWKPLSRRRCAWLLSQDSDDLDVESRLFLSHLEEQAPQVVQAGILAHQFTAIINGDDAEQLEPWLVAAEATELNALAKGIRRDIDAVRAAITEPWTTSPVEGQINRVKAIKRQMYGRAKYPLLKQRVLIAA